MDDLIYILVIIAWAAFALYRRSRQKAAQQTGHQKVPRPGLPIPSFDDILMDDEAQSMETLAPEIPSRAREFSTPSGRHIDSQEGGSLEEEFGSLESKSKGSDELNSRLTSARRSYEIMPDIEIETEPEDPETFDLRQAVIYAEILNRPYL